MVKWKKLNKKLVVLLTAAMMLFGSQATAFAYVDQGTEAAQEESTTETEEPVVEDRGTVFDHSRISNTVSYLSWLKSMK